MAFSQKRPSLTNFCDAVRRHARWGTGASSTCRITSTRMPRTKIGPRSGPLKTRSTSKKFSTRFTVTEGKDRSGKTWSRPPPPLPTTSSSSNRTTKYPAPNGPELHPEVRQPRRTRAVRAKRPELAGILNTFPSLLEYGYCRTEGTPTSIPDIKSWGWPLSWFQHMLPSLVSNM